MREGEAVADFDLEDKLEVNQLVELKVTAGRFAGKYSTQVVDIKNEEQFVINAPFSNRQPVKVPVNGRGEIRVGEEGGVYVLPVKVAARSFDATPLLILTLRGSVTRIQERQFFRLELEQKTKYRKIAENEQQFEKMVGTADNKLGEEELTLDSDQGLPELNSTGIIKDISAGGVKLSMEEKLKAGEILEIDFEFIDASFSTLFGKIIRVNKVVRSEIKKYEAGLDFINANQSYQDELTQWLFAKQRELRKKGLI